MRSITANQAKRHNQTTRVYYQNNTQQFQTSVNNFAVKATQRPSQDHQLFIKTPKILLVEDTAIIQLVHLSYLDSLGCQADLAKDGFEAIERFVNGYDLILLDIGLPDKNGIAKTGLDVVQEIRRYEKETNAKRNIIIALTAFGDTILEACLAAGCDDFYVKPLSLESLAKALQRWLAQHADPNKMRVSSRSHKNFSPFTACIT